MNSTTLDSEQRQRFQDTIYLVEADSYAQLALWKEYADGQATYPEVRKSPDGTLYCTCPHWRFSDPRTCSHVRQVESGEVKLKPSLRLDWTQERMYGAMLATTGAFHGHHVNIEISWAVINGKRVAFWQPVSTVVCHDAIKKWLGANFKCPMTDAMNFHHVLRELGV